jgi:YVTN family beta-propeller protein
MGAVPAVAQAGDMFVPNYTSQTVSVVNTTTNTVIHTIKFGSGGPWALAVAPDGKTAYEVNYDSNKMIPITVATYKKGAAIKLPGGTKGAPFAAAITPNGKQAYVVERGSGMLVPVNLVKRTAGKPISVGVASSLAITPDGKTVYVAASSLDEVVPVSTATDTAGPPIPVVAPQFVSVTPNGKTVWVQSTDGDLIAISTATNTTGTRIIGLSTDSPFGLAISPSGKMAYWSDYEDDVVYPVKLSKRRVGSAIPVGDGSEFPTLTPNGKTLYTSNYSDCSGGRLTPISPATNTPGGPITVGSGPGQLGIVPNQGPKAAFTSTVSGLEVSLNAKASSDSDGKVVKYVWGFGDGTSATTNSATTGHTYSRPGSYKVTLTVTDNEGCSTTQVFTGQTMYCNGSSAARASHTVHVT